MAYGCDSPIPAGKKCGCLPRKSHVGEWCPLLSEHIEVIPQADWPKYVGKVSCRPFVQTVLDQDGVGSCATESPTGGVKIARAQAGLPFVELNPFYIYHTTSHGTDSGSSIDENLVFIREYGIAPEASYPRSLGWRARPSPEAVEAAKLYRIEEFYDITSVAEMVSALLKGFPVIWGSNGHALCKVEHLNASEGLDLNSWGADWGDHGFGVWAPYSRVNWAYGAFAIRVATPSGGDQPPAPRGQ
jgi:hypothetical protein